MTRYVVGVGQDPNLVVGVRVIRGAKGEPGTNGLNGADGADGLPGPKGDKGDPGDAASNLITSVVGQTGDITGAEIMADPAIATRLSDIESAVAGTLTLASQHNEQHESGGSDPVQLAKSQITGLQADLDSKVSGSLLGAALGVATLDAGGKVPAAQLPSYVDDVVDQATLAAFPVTGEASKIYVAADTGKVYRWSGSVYAEISPSPGSTDAVPEGSVNLYLTNARVVSGLSSNASQARTNLGLGDSATKNTGTAAGTVAAGNDSRIVGAAQAGNNLSDMTNPGTARTNLGLGTAALANTGTGIGQVPLLGAGNVLPVSRMATGSPDGTKFIRDDGVLARPGSHITTTFTTPGTFTYTTPPGAKMLLVRVLGAGGGGASGDFQAPASPRIGGGGGAGGSYMEKWFGPERVDATYEVTVGAGGTGGTNSTAGQTPQAGGAGGMSQFTTGPGTASGYYFQTARAQGGGGGLAATGGGGASGGTTVPYMSFSGGVGRNGGNNAAGTSAGNDIVHHFAGTGGGGGGGGGDLGAFNGGAGGTHNWQDNLLAAAAGLAGSSGVNATNGAGGSSAVRIPGWGGAGGGGAHNTGSQPGDGGNGTTGCGGGGGGAASTNSARAGSGGNGGNGAVQIIAMM